MDKAIERFEGQRIEYEWGGYRWAAVAIARKDATDVWIASMEEERDQARFAFSVQRGKDCDLDKETIIAHAGATDAMLELGDAYLLDIDEYDEEACFGENEEAAEDEVFRFELGPLSVKASVAKAS